MDFEQFVGNSNRLSMTTWTAVGRSLMLAFALNAIACQSPTNKFREPPVKGEISDVVVADCRAATTKYEATLSSLGQCRKDADCIFFDGCFFVNAGRLGEARSARQRLLDVCRTVAHRDCVDPERPACLDGVCSERM
jgi:hypothetical protein